jgi:glycosyltransferase involved in cell wall biosynthesis
MTSGKPARSYRWVSRNFGHQNAFNAGLHHATGDAIVLMDGDLEDPPEILPELGSTWEEGFDTVYTVNQKPMTTSYTGGEDLRHRRPIGKRYPLYACARIKVMHNGVESRDLALIRRRHKANAVSRLFSVINTQNSVDYFVLVQCTYLALLIWFLVGRSLG